MKRARTDSELCIQSAEFEWSEQGLTQAHGYILPTLIEWLSHAGAETVLDLGCGNGALTHALATEGFHPTGLDSSESGIAIASQCYPQIEFTHSSLEAPLVDELCNRFDAVIAVEVVEHLLLPRFLFERAREALKQNGLFILTTPYHGYWKNLALAVTNGFDNHWHPLRDYGHVKFFSRETIARLFQEQAFDVTAFKRVGRVPALAKSMIVQGRLH
jgi:2-polyprenyl-6-hydroxyphenyl methylase/3-demethylubiquinone-9 3-methyltransferase